MIKFFRKIRKTLLLDNKTGKYFKYAIGEIMLVIIGILIALQINNWNEERKQKEVLINIYTAIKTDLQEDILNINKIISSTETIEEHYLAIINRTRKIEDFKDCKWCWSVNMGFADIKLRNNGIELLLEYNKIHNTSNDSLSIQLKSLYNDLGNDINVDIRELTEDQTSFMKNVLDTKPWFVDVVNGKFSKEFAEYATTNIRYRNYASLIHYIMFVKYIPDLKKYKTKGLELIKLIDEKIKE